MPTKTKHPGPRWEIKIVPGNRTVVIRIRRNDGWCDQYGLIDSKGWCTYDRPELIPESVRARARRLAKKLVDNTDESQLFARGE